MALVGKITDRATRATVFALEATILSIVMMIRGPLQGFIAETAGLRSLYLLAVIGLMASFFMLLRFFPDIEDDQTEEGKEREKRLTQSWKEQIRQVFARPDYRRNFMGMIQAGVLWRLFPVGLYPFRDIYLYDEIGWSFLFFGFYFFLTSFLATVLQIPFGKMIDKYHLRRIFFFAGPAAEGAVWLLMVFVRDPYHLAAIFLTQSAIEAIHVLAVRALWYDAIPLEVYSIGMAIVGVAYGSSAVLGSLLEHISGQI